MTLNERQKQALKQLEVALNRCSAEGLQDNITVTFITDHYKVRGFQFLVKEPRNG